MFLEAANVEGAVIYFYGYEAWRNTSGTRLTHSSTFVLHYAPAVITVVAYDPR